MSRSLVSLLLLVLMSGCVGTAGKDFARPDAAQVQLGRSVKANILAIYGEPVRQSSSVVTETIPPDANRVTTEFDGTTVPGSYATISYNYTVVKPPIEGGDVSSRSLIFVFWNDVLINFNYVSSFPNDSTSFDEGKLSQIVKSKTTKAEAFQIFGPPTGGAVFPAVKTNGDEKAIYEFIQISGQPRQVSSKLLELLFDGAGVVRDYRYTSNSQPLPVVPVQSAPVVTPIFIPAHR